MDGRDINRRSVPERPLLTNTSGISTLTRGDLTGKTGTLPRGALTGKTGTLPRGTLPRKQPGNKYQSSYEAMDALQTTLPRHKPVSDFNPDYEPVEDDGAVRKINLGTQGTSGFSNPSYADDDDYQY